MLHAQRLRGAAGTRDASQFIMIGQSPQLHPVLLGARRQFFGRQHAIGQIGMTMQINFAHDEINSMKQENEKSPAILAGSGGRLCDGTDWLAGDVAWQHFNRNCATALAAVLLFSGCLLLCRQGLRQRDAKACAGSG